MPSYGHDTGVHVCCECIVLIGNSVCLSPELAVSRRFAKKVLEHPAFRERQIFVIIDEVHVVELWSTFRKEYGKLWQFRTRLPPSTRMLGCSATLDDETRQKVVQNGGFRDPQILNTTTDRPEIYLEFRTDRSIGQSHMGLRFLFPDQLSFQDIHNIEKTIIFFDTKQGIRLAYQECREWLIEAGLKPQEADQVIGVYYSSIRTKTKRRISDSFALANSTRRIMLATEAMGMGIEIEGLKNVVQYDNYHITNNVRQLKVLAQRMGRAARGLGELGHFIWLVRPWVLPSLQPHAVAFHQSSRLQTSETIDYDDDMPPRKKKSVSNQRESIHKIYRQMCVDCPRKVLREFFTPTGSRLPLLPVAVNPRCCFRCQPNLRYKDRSIWTWARYQAVQREIENSHKAEMVGSQESMLLLPQNHNIEGAPARYGPLTVLLRDWRKEKAARLTELYETIYRPEMVLPDDALERLARGAEVYTGELGTCLINHFVPSWSRRSEFAEEIKRLIENWLNSPTRMDTERKSTFNNQEKLKRDRHFEQLASIRLQRYVRRYGQSVDAVKSDLPGDDIDQWVRVQGCKQKQKTKHSDGEATRSTQPISAEISTQTVPRTFERFISGPDDEEQSQDEGSQSIPSTARSTTKTAPPRRLIGELQTQRQGELSAPSQVNDSVVTALERRSPKVSSPWLSDPDGPVNLGQWWSIALSPSRPSSQQTNRPKTPNQELERASRSLQTPLTHRPSPQTQRVSLQRSVSALRHKRGGKNQGEGREEIGSIVVNSSDSDSTTISAQSVSKRGRQRTMSRKLRESKEV